MAAETVDLWLKSGIQPSEIALLFRDPEATLEQLLSPHHRLAALAMRCRVVGIPMMLACAPADHRRALALFPQYRLIGLHLRHDPCGTVLADCRRALQGRLLGRSVHGDPGDPSPADYTLFAPVFPPQTSQPGVVKIAAGLDTLAQWCRTVPEPIFALGGITPDRATACLQAGAYGLAGIRTFFGEPGRVIEDGARLVAAVRAHP